MPIRSRRTRCFSNELADGRTVDPSSAGRSATRGMLVNVDLLAGDHRSAAVRLDELERLDPGSSLVEYYRSQLAEKQGRVDEAIDRLTAVTERRPSIYYLSRLAEMEYRNGESPSRGSIWTAWFEDFRTTSSPTPNWPSSSFSTAARSVPTRSTRRFCAERRRVPPTSTTAGSRACC